MSNYVSEENMHFAQQLSTVLLGILNNQNTDIDNVSSNVRLAQRYTLEYFAVLEKTLAGQD